MKSSPRRNADPAGRALLAALVLWALAALPAGAGVPEPMKAPPEPADNRATPEKIALGRTLFFDRRLSGDGTMSCATCHIPDLAFTDGQELSLSYPTTKNWRNAPTLVNVAFLERLLHDGRAGSLEEQALMPIRSPFEMNLDLDFLEEKVRGVPAYVDAFGRVFGGEATRQRIAKAVAAFERTLVSRNAPWDRFLKGDTAALSAGAAKGYGIFTGKGKCAACHGGALLSDQRFYALLVPEVPRFRDDPQVAATRRFVARSAGYGEYGTLREDPGRFLATARREDWKAFRTPSLREVAKTAPYMHNGVFATLDEVIDFFDRGGGPGNAALAPLGLSPAEKADLRSFLVEALSGDDVSVRPPEIP